MKTIRDKLNAVYAERSRLSLEDYWELVDDCIEQLEAECAR